MKIAFDSYNSILCFSMSTQNQLTYFFHLWIRTFKYAAFNVLQELVSCSLLKISILRKPWVIATTLKYKKKCLHLQYNYGLIYKGTTSAAVIDEDGKHFLSKISTSEIITSKKRLSRCQAFLSVVMLKLLWICWVP